MVKLGNDWDYILEGEFQKEYYKKLRTFLIKEYSEYEIFPPMHDIFNALKATPYDSVKAVILGQDPYHGREQAHGMCFSVKKSIRKPPSLENIFKELHDDIGCPVPEHGSLVSWAEQGVLLLNTVMTVRSGQPNSHKGRGWEIFTDSVISHLNDRAKPMIFLLWGANAKTKTVLLTNSKHKILKAAHPSPLSAYNGFFGSRHFSKTNEFLESCGQEPIDWEIE